jgi:NADH dehydrogenase
MAGTVFVTGGSGFVGAAVIEELLSRNYSVNALVNRKTLPPRERLRSISGGLFDTKALDEGMKGAAAVIHIVGIIMERPIDGITFERVHVDGTKSVVDAAKRNGVKRYLHMSALGTRPGAVSRYHQTKFAAEEYVRASELDWTIFRPSLIHGPAGEFMHMEAKWARHKSPPFLFMPYFGAGPFGCGGAGLLQPVYVKDVARAFVDAIEKPGTVGEIYPLGGPDRLSWPELHRTCAQAIVGKRRLVAPIPAWYARVLSQLLPASLLGFNRDQVIMSQEDNTCDVGKFKGDFGWDTTGFESSLQSYARQL